MGFKNNKVKYFITKVGYLDKGCKDVNKEEKFELTPKQMLDLTYGILDYKMIEKIIGWLKDEQ